MQAQYKCILRSRVHNFSREPLAINYQMLLHSPLLIKSDDRGKHKRGLIYFIRNAPRQMCLRRLAGTSIKCNVMQPRDSACFTY